MELIEKLTDAIDRMLNWFIPSAHMNDVETKRQARIVIIFCMVGQIFFLVTAIKWLKVHETVLAINLLFTMVLIGGVAMLLKMSVPLKILGHLVALILFWYFSFYTYRTGGIESSAIYWFLVLPLFTVILTGLRGTVIWLVLVLVEILWYAYLQKQGVDLYALNLPVEDLPRMRAENIVKQLAAVTVSVTVLEQIRLKIGTAQKKALEHMNEAVEANERAKEEIEKKAAALEEASLAHQDAVREQEAARQEAERRGKRLQEVFGQILALAERLNDESEHMRQSGATLQKQLEINLTQSKEVAGRNDEIHDHLQRMTQEIHETSSAMAHVTSSAEEAESIAAQAISQANEAGRLTSGLKESSQRIGQIIKVITGISTQTNLLALNATIEAARAGEAGRGFTVVADEIKKLASKTGESAEEITRQITENNDKVDTVVETSNAFSGTVTQIGQLQQSVGTLVRGQQSRAQEIADRIAVSANHSTTIVKACDVLGQGMEQSNEAIATLRRSARELAEIAATLHDTCRSETLGDSG
ncbi:Methyl-accepting transducer domain-containing protein [Sulfidibacter corallicola]|uniref:Methyl-accepting transducer domain-containing protein n=1 Tax=Sulfidibacter corallicola TaxID=2818388 RepID=A0A8A4TGB3_SULCO|nr:methyl-accepting chemotaxis protein [Sulfidibacter corallicola]QTD48956.1 hypothetical protein J3U87_25510 [Sulfidibacter corallicola]